jgi:hypothetical protein
LKLKILLGDDLADRSLDTGRYFEQERFAFEKYDDGWKAK